MINGIKRFGFLMKETVREWLDDGAASIAAALAYYAVFSLSPLIILLALILGLVMDQRTIESSIVEPLEPTIGQQVAAVMRTLLVNARADTSNALATIVWFAIVIWGASNMFAQLHNALNKIWEVRARPGRSPWHLVRARLLSFAIVMLCTLALFATMVINTTLNALTADNAPTRLPLYLVRPAQLAMTLTVATFLIAIMFKVLPDVIIRLRDVLVGAFFTAVLFYFGQFLVGIYLANTNVGSVFGAAGSLTAILVWIYYSAQILLFGAEFTEVWARHHGVYIRPDKNAVWKNPLQAKREAERANLEFNDPLELH